MPTFGKGLDLRRAAEEAFEVKDVLNSTLDSEILKQTLYRQAKNQVGTQQSPPPAPPGWMAGGSRASFAGGRPMRGAQQDHGSPGPLPRLERRPSDSYFPTSRGGAGRDRGRCM